MTLNPLFQPLEAVDAPNFHLMDFSDPTLLVSGTRASITWLAQAFAADRTFELCQSTSQGMGSLTIKPTYHDTGTLIETDGHFLWNISKNEARECYAALVSLAVSPHPAHQFLDPDTRQTNRQIVVSLGEYDRLP